MTTSPASYLPNFRRSRMDKDTQWSSFGKWVAPLHSQIIFNWQFTSRLDSYVKKLDTLTFLLIFIEAQLKQRRGLRQIMNEVQNNADFHQALGITSISDSQLSRKNNKLDPEVLQAILCDLMTQLHRLRSPVPARIGIVKIIDSTTMSLCLN
jgi:hypothetical protein